MKIACISDTHNRHWDIRVPEADMVIHAGDMTATGTWPEIINFNKWFSGLPHKHKILIAGNHDRDFEKSALITQSLLADNITYLENSGVTIEGINFWGSPVQPAFCDWAFNRERGAEIDRYWQMIPEDTHVLITHGPPLGILDEVYRGINAGCEDLAERIKSLTQLKLHVFGHIHEAAGADEKDGVMYINAACLNRRYDPVNPPQVTVIEV